MTDSQPEPSKPLEVKASSIARRWLLASLAGSTMSTTIACAGFLDTLPIMVQALVAVGGGAAAAAALVPWRSLRKMDEQDAALRELRDRAKLLVDGHRRFPLRDIIVDRDDLVGDLSRAIHDVAADAIATRRRTRLLYRRLGDDVKRETRRATAHLFRQATTDPLTGLGNRRAMEHLIQTGAAFRTLDNGSPGCLTVMLIDVDLFKEINDTLGHEAGDQCLVFLARLLKSSLRREDHAIRLGGDEFVVLMPGQPLALASVAAERLCALYAQMPWPHRQVPRPTLSIGLASGRATVDKELTDLLRQADAALYESKRAGRGCVRGFEPQCDAA